MPSSHFKNKTSPLLMTGLSYSYILIASILFYVKGFYENSDFFAWGPPIKFFGKDITTQESFYTLHLIVFFHQIINNCVNSITYAWIINSVQDPKNKVMEYSKKLSLSIIVLFDIYSELDVVFIVGGFTSQISFVVTIVTANVITSAIINYKYLSEKDEKKRITPSIRIDDINSPSNRESQYGSVKNTLEDSFTLYSENV